MIERNDIKKRHQEKTIDITKKKGMRGRKKERKNERKKRQKIQSKLGLVYIFVCVKTQVC